MARNPDVLVVGGGIVGAAVAFRLALEKLRVVLLERGDLGREASWTAGGILTPVHLSEYLTPLAALCSASMKLYPGLLEQLRALSPLDPEYRVTGLLLVWRDEAGENAARALEEWKRRHDQPVERLSREEALARQPGLNPQVRGALFLPDIAQVRNHRLTAALAEAAARLGAELRPATPVTGFLRVPGRVTGVKTPRGDLYAGTVVLAAGAWSGEPVRSVGLDLRVFPVKGQMLLAQAAPGFCPHVLLEGETYFVPRADGRLLIGSTLEDAGFDKTVTLQGVGDLARRAAEILPESRRLPLVQSWAGLRPATPDRLPYLGRAPLEGLLVATGHFRNGILLAPVTAEIVADLLTGRPPRIPLEPFSPSRHAGG
jgi:glycine oxidase